MLTGTLASRVIAILAIPILARIYTPAEFGLLAMFMTINAIVSSVACARYEMAIVLPEDDADAMHILLACVAISTGVSLACFCLYWLFGTELAQFVGIPELAPYLWLSPLAIWFIGAFNACQSWASRTGQFSGISRAIVAGTFSTVTTQFLMGFPQKLLAGGLIVGQSIGRLMQFSQLVWCCRKSMRASFAQGIAWSRIRELLSRYRNFPIYDSTASLLNSSSRELPVLMLGIFFTPTIIGFYSVGRRMLKVPMQLIDNAISRVFFPKARQEMQKGNLPQLVLTVFVKLSTIGVVPMLSVTVIAPAVVGVFLGETWEESGIYVQWLSIWLLIVFITAPFAQLFNVLEKQRARLLYQIVLMLVRFSALLIGGMLDQPVLAVALFSVASAIVSMLNCLWLLKASGLSPGIPVRYFFLELFKAIPFIAAIAGLNWWLQADWQVLIAAAIVLGVFALMRYRGALNRDYIEIEGAAH